jgi:hypothetical protein
MSESHSFPFIQTDLRIYWIKISKFWILKDLRMESESLIVELHLQLQDEEISHQIGGGENPHIHHLHPYRSFDLMDRIG